MTLDTIRQKKASIVRLAAMHGSSNVRVFGSVARDEADAKSDVDFMVDLAPGRSLFDLGGLLMDLQELLECKIDIVTERGLRDDLRERVMQDALPL